jgi:hypothetical protein
MANAGCAHIAGIRDVTPSALRERSLAYSCRLAAEKLAEPLATLLVIMPVMQIFSATRLHFCAAAGLQLKLI